MGTLSLVAELGIAVFAVAVAVGVPLSGILIEHRETRRSAALQAAHRSISQIPEASELVNV